ncbi:MAG: hypothetical protein J6K04_08530 [Lachnospiraceae bacterium]|nr:hypothetical protein [Lachnospiraceae bacterium]
MFSLLSMLIHIINSIFSGIYTSLFLKPKHDKKTTVILWSIIYFIMQVVMDAAERADTEDMQQELLAFSNRVSAMKQEEYQIIRGLRNKQQLFSYPMPSIAKIIV